MVLFHFFSRNISFSHNRLYIIILKTQVMVSHFGSQEEKSWIIIYHCLFKKKKRRTTISTNFFLMKRDAEWLNLTTQLTKIVNNIKITLDLSMKHCKLFQKEINRNHKTNNFLKKNVLVDLTKLLNSNIWKAKTSRIRRQ